MKMTNLMLKLIFRSLRPFTSFKRKFFEANPLYPDDESALDLNQFRARVPPSLLERQIAGELAAEESDKAMIYQLFHKKKFSAFSDKKAERWQLLCQNNPDRLINAHQFAAHKVFDKETGLPLGLGYDEMITEFKRDTFKANDKYRGALNGLVLKIGKKNIVQLLRLFKKALVLLRAESYQQQLKGQLLKAGVQTSVELQEAKDRQIRRQALVRAGDQFHEQLKHSMRNQQLEEHDIYFGLRKQAFKLENKDVENQFDRRKAFSREGDFDAERGLRGQLLVEVEERYRAIKNFKHQPQQFTTVLQDKGPLTLQTTRDQDLRDQIQAIAAEMNTFDKAVGRAQLADVEGDLQIAIDQSPLYFRALIERDSESENPNFTPMFKDRRLNPEDLVWGNLPIDQTINLDPRDINHAPRKEKPSELSPDVRIQAGLHSLPLALYKHPLKDTIRFYAERNPEAKFRFDLELLDPEDRVGYYRAKSNADLERRNHRTNWTKNGKAFGGGACKKSSAMAVIKPAVSGKASINYMKPFQYFFEPYYRAMALAPIYLAGFSTPYEVRLFVRGGGKRGKAQACQNALARAIVKLKPELKNYFRQQGMITLDKRNKQPKHLNLYKARKRYPYVRR